MNKKIIIEAVPNFSEGRNIEIIQSIAAAAKSVDGVTLIHVDPNPDANRTVYTLVGNPKSVINALYRMIATAAETIDMRLHKGAHPRIGACDVCPLIPIKHVDIAELQPYVHELAHILGQKLSIPVFLYELSAQYDYKKNLADIRKGEYEGLETKMQSSEWKSDNNVPFNSVTGATVLGVRPLLIAYNVNLETEDVNIAKRIAAKMRYSSGGPFVGLKAIGWYMAKYGRSQVSFNITDITAISIAQVFEEVKKLAKTFNIEVNSSELIGLMSEECLKFALSYYNLSCDRKGEQSLIQMLGLDFLGSFDWDHRIIERLMKSKSQI